MAADRLWKVPRSIITRRTGIAMSGHRLTRFRPWRVSLRAFLAIVFLLCLWLGLKVERAADQRRAYSMVLALKGRASYSERDTITPARREQNHWAPAWLWDLAGQDFFVALSTVDFTGVPLNDEEFATLARHLARVPSLKVLALECRGLTHSGLQHLDQLRQIRQLRLWNLACHADELAAVSKLKKLSHFHILSEHIEGDVLQHLRSLPHLKFLDLDGGWCVDGSLDTLPQLRHLTNLGIRSPNISDAGLAPVTHLARLETLDLSAQRLTDAGLRRVGQLKNLKGLTLAPGQSRGEFGYADSDQVSAAGLSHLCGLPRLEWLKLWYIHLDRACFEQLRQIPHLEHLAFESYAPDDDVIAELKRFDKLRFLEAPLDRQQETELHNALPNLEIYNP